MGNLGGTNLPYVEIIMFWQIEEYVIFSLLLSIMDARFYSIVENRNLHEFHLHILNPLIPMLGKNFLRLILMHRFLQLHQISFVMSFPPLGSVQAKL